MSRVNPYKQLERLLAVVLFVVGGLALLGVWKAGELIWRLFS